MIFSLKSLDENSLCKTCLFVKFSVPIGQGAGEPMAREPDVAPLMIASGSLAHRKILPDISSKSTALRVMLSTFATNHALFKIIHALSHIKHVLLLKVINILMLKILYGSHGNTF